MHIQEVSYRSPWYVDVRNLRYHVMRKPLGLDPGTERFPHENSAQRFVALRDKSVVGCVLLHPWGKEGQIVDMTVAPQYQHQGIGKELVEFIEKCAHDLELVRLYCNAFHDSVDFFERMGFSPMGDAFDELGFKRVRMIKWLKKPPHTI